MIWKWCGSLHTCCRVGRHRGASCHRYSQRSHCRKTTASPCVHHLYHLNYDCFKAAMCTQFTTRMLDHHNQRLLNWSCVDDTAPSREVVSTTATGAVAVVRRAASTAGCGASTNAVVTPAAAVTGRTEAAAVVATASVASAARAASAERARGGHTAGRCRYYFLRARFAGASIATAP